MKANMMTVIVENRAGTLSRVTGMFTRRGINIENLSVVPCENPEMSRITIAVFGDDAQIGAVMRHLNRLIDVITVSDLTDNE
jgi:acetolactate synthase-1/3 small subunit